MEALISFQHTIISILGVFFVLAGLLLIHRKFFLKPEVEVIVRGLGEP